MNMNIFKQSAVLLKDNLMVMQPLFIWALVTMLVAMPLSAKRGMDIGFIFSLSIVILCFIAFLSGWYNCIKATVANKSKVYETPEEKNKAQIEILKNFFPGVGEYILPTGLAAILYGGISYGIFVLYKYLAIQTFIGAKIPNELIKLMGTGTQEQVTNSWLLRLEIIQPKKEPVKNRYKNFFCSERTVSFFACGAPQQSKNKFV